MRWDIPECKRCFFCLPLRYGIIILGYLNLLFGLLILTMESTYLVRRGNGTIDVTSHTMTTYKGVTVYVQAWLPLLLYAAEVVFNIILLFGAHTRRIKFMRVYYYYGITTLLATFATFLIIKLEYVNIHYYDAIELCVTFIGIVSQAYLLLLIRSEMTKRRYKGGTNSYENHLTHASYPPNWREAVLL